MPRKRKEPGPKHGRTDLNRVGDQPISVPTGLPYGEAGAQRAMQQAVPLPDSDPLAAALEQLAGMPQNMAVVGMGGPSGYPDEPVTHGLPIGPGAGPEVLATMPRRDVSETLLRLAGTSGDGRLLALAQRAASQGV